MYPRMVNFYISFLRENEKSKNPERIRNSLKITFLGYNWQEGIDLQEGNVCEKKYKNQIFKGGDRNNLSFLGM